MRATRRDIAYSVISRLEEGMRLWLASGLFKNFGTTWIEQIPAGVWEKLSEKEIYKENLEIDPESILDETDFPDLMEIVCYKSNYPKYFASSKMNVSTFRDRWGRLYDVRCKIAHVKKYLSALDVDLLLEIAEAFVPLLDQYGAPLKQQLDLVNKNPEHVSAEIPADFYAKDATALRQCLTNLPTSDYDPDGGFVGRKDELSKIEGLLMKNLDRVITITGAGGVGKSALVHQICQTILESSSPRFLAIVWVGAKEERLTASGIEAIEPDLHNYDALLDSILETYGWTESLSKSVDKKQELVEIILNCGDKGILLVVDNLETVKDQKVIEFIKEMPHPNKVLITSRRGLGEVERRYPLSEMLPKDAIVLFRTVAREKGLSKLAGFPDDSLLTYVNKMARYPLAIKWVLGQVALGRDINKAIGQLTASTGDVAKFCFEHIFDVLLDDDSRTVLYALAAYEAPVVRGVLSHLSNLTDIQLDDALEKLVIASLVNASPEKIADGKIETRYGLLSLTQNYIQGRLRANPKIHQAILGRIQTVQDLLAESAKADRQYNYFLEELGARSEEELIASTWILSGNSKAQSANFVGADEDFERAANIAPNFAAVYRSWAAVDAQSGSYQKAEQKISQALKINRDDPKVWIAWANIEKQRQNFNQAAKYMSKALDLSPNDPAILMSLGSFEKRRANYERAHELLLLAMQRYGDIGAKRSLQVCHTALADNLKRWAEHFSRNGDRKQAREKLKLALDYASQASVEAPGDDKALQTVKEVSLDLGLLMRNKFEAAERYLLAAITEQPATHAQRRTTSTACYFLACDYLLAQDREKAQRFFELGKSVAPEGSRWQVNLKDMEKEFLIERSTGTLTHVVAERGYGFLTLDGEAGDQAYLHRKQLIEPATVDQFEQYKGRRFSFLLQAGPDGKAPQAERAWPLD